MRLTGIQIESLELLIVVGRLAVFPSGVRVADLYARLTGIQMIMGSNHQ